MATFSRKHACGLVVKVMGPRSCAGDAVRAAFVEVFVSARKRRRCFSVSTSGVPTFRATQSGGSGIKGGMGMH